MQDIHFGYCVPIFASPGTALFRTPNYAALDTAATMRLARQADALGYDDLWSLITLCWAMTMPSWKVGQSWPRWPDRRGEPGSA